MALDQRHPKIWENSPKSSVWSQEKTTSRGHLCLDFVGWKPEDELEVVSCAIGLRKLFHFAWAKSSPYHSPRSVQVISYLYIYIYIPVSYWLTDFSPNKHCSSPTSEGKIRRFTPRFTSGRTRVSGRFLTNQVHHNSSIKVPKENHVHWWNAHLASLRIGYPPKSNGWSNRFPLWNCLGLGCSYL